MSQAFTVLEHETRDAIRRAGNVISNATNIRVHVPGSAAAHREQQRYFKSRQRDGETRSD